MRPRGRQATNESAATRRRGSQRSLSHGAYVYVGEGWDKVRPFARQLTSFTSDHGSDADQRRAFLTISTLTRH
ncbi:hypothetical protein AAHC03_09829 [Spirometra sp. Aus1]